MNRKMQILAVIASLVAVAVTAPDGSAATAVEGTYEYREVSVVSGTRFPHRYQWSQSFSAATIKQGEPLEFPRAREDRGMALVLLLRRIRHQADGAELPGRLHASRTSTPRHRRGDPALRDTLPGPRLARSQDCAPSCPNGIGTCPYYGTQYHELTGTVPGSETATLKPGGHLLETHWEHAPRPRRRESSKANQGRYHGSACKRRQRHPERRRHPHPEHPRTHHKPLLRLPARQQRPARSTQPRQPHEPSPQQELQDHASGSGSSSPTTAAAHANKSSSPQEPECSPGSTDHWAQAAPPKSHPSPTGYPGTHPPPYASASSPGTKPATQAQKAAHASPSSSRGEARNRQPNRSGASSHLCSTTTSPTTTATTASGRPSHSSR